MLGHSRRPDPIFTGCRWYSRCLCRLPGFSPAFEMVHAFPGIQHLLAVSAQGNIDPVQPHRCPCASSCHTVQHAHYRHQDHRPHTVLRLGHTGSFEVPGLDGEINNPGCSCHPDLCAQSGSDGFCFHSLLLLHHFPWRKAISFLLQVSKCPPGGAHVVVGLVKPVDHRTCICRSEKHQVTCRRVEDRFGGIAEAIGYGGGLSRRPPNTTSPS